MLAPFALRRAGGLTDRHGVIHAVAPSQRTYPWRSTVTTSAMVNVCMRGWQTSRSKECAPLEVERLRRVGT